jgi:hypothetical protein
MLAMGKSAELETSSGSLLAKDDVVEHLVFREIAEVGKPQHRIIVVTRDTLKAFDCRNELVDLLRQGHVLRGLV